MKTLVAFSLLCSLITASLNGQSLLNQATNAINNATQNSGGKGSNLSNDEVVSGLREALNIGSKNASGSASKRDGFLKNSLIKTSVRTHLTKIKLLTERSILSSDCRNPPFGSYSNTIENEFVRTRQGVIFNLSNFLFKEL